jgi:hypothetical protein
MNKMQQLLAMAVLALVLSTGCGKIVSTVVDSGGNQPLNARALPAQQTSFICPKANITQSRSSLAKNSPGRSYRVDIVGLKTVCKITGDNLLTQIKIKFRLMSGPGNNVGTVEARYVVSASDPDGRNNNRKSYNSYFPIPEPGTAYETVEIVEHIMAVEQGNARLTVGLEPEARQSGLMPVPTRQHQEILEAISVPKGQSPAVVGQSVLQNPQRQNATEPKNLIWR